MPKPLISVCVPVHNGGLFIRENLNSLYSQTYPNLEILISDDFSNDNSVPIIRNIKNKDTQIYLQPKRLGWVGNCNFLIGKSSGVYFSILPQDDLIPHNYYEKLYTGFEKNNLAINCYPYIKSIGHVEGLIQQPSITGTLENRIYEVISNHFWAVSFRGLVKNNLPEQLRYLSTDQHQDMMADTLWILQHAIAGELHAIDLPYYKRYHHSGEHSSWSQKPLKDKITAWSQHCAALYAYAIPFVSDQKKLYTACLNRLIQNKQYLVEIKNDEFDHQLLNTFNEKINHVQEKD